MKNTPPNPSQKPVIVDCSFGLQRHRTVLLVVGNEYAIEPLNPAKKKNRGRRCVVLSFDAPMPSEVSVRFLDTNRQGRVAVSDLLYDNAPSPA